ncbi:hypothetical protein ACFUC1_04740 [Pedococcus sp. NPDC057267]|uniref:hypothetical protein n=1 Tax=Pedococcus sp. NPDC057267 TaxID=3346077 RepID=UPI0036301F63
MDETPAHPVPPSVRAQVLATEHWSLLATRSMTWSEVMSRITIHLTVTSASLVVLALVAQATGFGTGFRVMAIGLAAYSLVLGTLTAVRVHNASHDDAAMVIGMNLLRAAYLELDPGIAPFLVAGTTGDRAGLMRTYLMGSRRSTFSHVVASTVMFMNAVNTMVAGTLGALVAYAVGAGTVGTTVAGVLAAVAHLGAMVEWGRRTFGVDPPRAGPGGVP